MNKESGCPWSRECRKFILEKFTQKKYKCKQCGKKISMIESLVVGPIGPSGWGLCAECCQKIKEK